MAPAALALTPYMGCNTYYGVGGVFDEETITSVANAIVDRGLAGAGYRIVWLDYGWASGDRDRDGDLVIDARQWPQGLEGLTDYLHARGLLAGIYTDGGHSGCHGQGVGSFGHYQQDADRFAAWGFDAVKVDFCGGGQERLDPVRCYRDFTKALRGNASGRPLLINVCNFWQPGQVGDAYPPLQRSAHANYLWASQIADSWRTDTDIGFSGRVAFADVLRNLDANAAHPEAAGPGHWNDPDYLCPELGMTAAEAQAQFTMWALVAAPLIIGSDVRVLSSETMAMLTNADVIAINQDPLGAQGTRVAHHGDREVWVKPLCNGDRAVALLNRGSVPARIVTDANETGLPRAAAYDQRNLWTRQTEQTTAAIGNDVASHSAVLYRVTTITPD